MFIGYKFTQEELEICKKHAREVNVTTCYGNRDGQTDMTKTELDAYVGKLAEFMVYGLMRLRYPDLTAPDVAVYLGKSKSWKPDMECSEFYVSVKGQDSRQSMRFGTSWVFQRTDKSLQTLDKPIKVALCTIDLDEGTGRLYKFINKDDIVFGEMKIESLRATKKCVYLKDLEGEHHEA